MISFIVFIIRIELIQHKLTYSKVLKGDAWVAIMALLVSLVVGYLALATVGSMAVSLADLTIMALYVSLIVYIFITAIRCRAYNLRRLSKTFKNV